MIKAFSTSVVVQYVPFYFRRAEQLQDEKQYSNTDIFILCNRLAQEVEDTSPSFVGDAQLLVVYAS